MLKKCLHMRMEKFKVILECADYLLRGRLRGCLNEGR